MKRPLGYLVSALAHLLVLGAHQADCQEVGLCISGPAPSRRAAGRGASSAPAEPGPIRRVFSLVPPTAITRLAITFVSELYHTSSPPLCLG